MCVDSELTCELMRNMDSKIVKKHKQVCYGNQLLTIFE